MEFRWSRVSSSLERECAGRVRAPQEYFSIASVSINNIPLRQRILHFSCREDVDLEETADVSDEETEEAVGVKPKNAKAAKAKAPAAKKITVRKWSQIPRIRVVKTSF